MTEKIDCAVIGAGVVGLAVARALAQRGREVILLEAADAIGTHTSSRNSEVIHAGIYYPTGSLKARLCVAGKHALYAFCAEHRVAHRRIGKLLVATADDQIPALQKYYEQARLNGVDDLQWLAPDALREMEPALACSAGFLSPSTGIVDSHGLMLALLGDAENAGAVLALKSPVVSGKVGRDGIRLDVGGAEPAALRCGTVINCAGLHAQQVSRTIAGIPEPTIPPTHYAIGHYYTLSGRSPFQRLIYPVARQDWLGVHVTLDLAGRARFGPDFQWIDRVDYRFDDSRTAAFQEAIRRYYPGLADDALQPGYTGIRPKITGPGETPADFMIQGSREYGVDGLVCLYGIESPGLTSSLAIGDYVAGLLHN
jgi:L-2-hydroxyglutarate oxidase LhgO